MRSARRVFSLGVRWGDVDVNPFAKMELSAAPARETVIPREHVDLFCETAITIGRRSMAVWARLSFELCQRAGDARLLPWTRYNGREVQVKQSKRGALVWAPLLPDLPELKALVDETPRLSPVIVVDERTGRPYTLYNLSKAFNEIRDAAHLPVEYQARDMRRAGMDETGDAGATDDELRSLSGHKDRNTVSVYVKPNRRKAANALAKRRAYRADQPD
jgi:integrase